MPLWEELEHAVVAAFDLGDSRVNEPVENRVSPSGSKKFDGLTAVEFQRLN
jgi:hypothetical protein